jgi:hypothetical protein
MSHKVGSQSDSGKSVRFRVSRHIRNNASAQQAQSAIFGRITETNYDFAAARFVSNPSASVRKRDFSSAQR